MADENDGRSGDGEGLDASEILDPDFNQEIIEDDIDFELDDIIAEGEKSPEAAFASEEEVTPEGEGNYPAADGEPIDEDTGLTLEDIVFGEESEVESEEGELDFEPQEEAADSEELPLDKTDQGETELSFEEDEEDIDFELDEVVEETPEAIEAETDGSMDEGKAEDVGLPLDKTAQGEAELSFEE
ncbi:MAG: hypothetical protein JRI34_11930, partial [Deltaproteobacteria bacterium]|nr:hypothetical protein [Deltaproteobacteria bacterium]